MHSATALRNHSPSLPVLQPPNIFLDSKGDAYLADFGAARRQGMPAEERTRKYLPEDAPGVDTAGMGAWLGTVLKLEAPIGADTAI